MKQRHRTCIQCPFNPARNGIPIPADVMDSVVSRIKDGERWICHMSCDGAEVTSKSVYCAGAPFFHFPGS